jgi:enoyl-[acyl-carrier-protein] reductase (NADH)
MLRSGDQSADNFEAMHKRNPLHRGVTPSDIADAILYLATAPCVTGQVLLIDSGQRFLSLERDVQFLET